MATVDLTGSINAYNNSRAASDYSITVSVNVLAAQTAKGSTLATGDVLRVIEVPTGFAVDFVALNVTTAVTGSSAFTISLGDGTTAALWTSAVSALATGAATASTAGAVSLVYVPSGGYVNATLGTVTGAPTAGVFTVTATLKPLTQATNAGTPTF